MANGTLPTKDADLVTWGDNFVTRTQTGFATYGLTTVQQTLFANAQTAWKASYVAASSPITRTKASIAAKNDQRTLFKKQAAKTVLLVRGFSGITNELLIQLGIDVAPAERTPIPPPDVSPMVDVDQVRGSVVDVFLHGPDSTRRGKPAGVAGITVLSYVGEAPPTDPSLWKLEGNTTRTKMSIVFPLSVVPGTTVWIAAFYFNAKTQSGALSTPTQATIGFGGLSAVPQLQKRAA